MLISIPDMLEWAELKEIRAAVAGAQFVDGKRTAGYRAQRVKHNPQLDRGAPDAHAVKSLILAALRRNPAFQRAAMSKYVRPPLISRHEEGMNYGLHVDGALMGEDSRVRTDLSVTVFLNDPTDYEGGELVMMSPYGEWRIKQPAGSAVVYPSSTLHRVDPVTQGARLAAVTWAQSHVRDPARREILYDIWRIRERLAKADPDAEESDLAFKTYAILTRMWSE